LFSDNDIKWRENGIQYLIDALDENPDASYSYGAYQMAGRLLCNQPYKETDLMIYNYISTMSLIRANDFPGFDESLKRFQDWDLWLTMMEQGKHGVFCGQTVFDTELKDGISHNGVDHNTALNIVKAKHLL